MVGYQALDPYGDAHILEVRHRRQQLGFIYVCTGMGGSSWTYVAAMRLWMSSFELAVGNLTNNVSHSAG